MIITKQCVIYKYAKNVPTASHQVMMNSMTNCNGSNSQ